MGWKDKFCLLIFCFFFDFEEVLCSMGGLVMGKGRLNGLIFKKSLYGCKFLG